MSLRTCHLVRYLGLALIMGSGLCGCRTVSPTVDLWVVHDRYGSPPSSEGSFPRPRTVAAAHVELSSASNETVSFRIGVRAEGPAWDDLHFEITSLASLEGRIDPASVQILRMHRVQAGDPPGWVIRSIPRAERVMEPLDMLVPLAAPQGGLPAQLLPGEVYHFWVDVAVSRGAPPGDYDGNIQLLSGRTVVGTVALHLTVDPIMLPDVDQVPFIAELDHRALFRHHLSGPAGPPSLTVDDWRDVPSGNRMDSLLLTTLRMLRSHRLTPVLPHLAPVVRLDARGVLALDWGQYDTVAEPCLSGGAFVSRTPLQLWPLPPPSVFASVRNRDGDGGTDYADVIRAYLEACADHFDERGWLARSYAIVPNATAPGLEAFRSVREFTELAHRANDGISVVSRLWPQDMAPFGWTDYPAADSSVDVNTWLPPAQFFDVATMREQRRLSRRTWLAVDRPPYSGSSSIHAQPGDIRVLPWQARRMGAQAIHLGCINESDEAIVIPTPRQTVEFLPTALLYPGGSFGLDAPVVSTRLKHLRRCLQDAAYMALLDEHGLAHVTDALARSIVPHAGSDAYRSHFADGRRHGWATDSSAFDIARDIMAKELVRQATSDSDATTTEALSRTTTWRRFMLETRGLYLDVDGTRMSTRGTRLRWEADVECFLTIVNHTREPVSGEIRFAALPEGWSALPLTETLLPVPANSSRTVWLTALATTLPVNADGFVDLPIELELADGATYETRARVSYMTANRITTKLRIDGDLSDWSSSADNVAADFRSIAGPRYGKADRFVADPFPETICFVTRDEQNLYIAINAERDKQTAPAASRRNRVQYDDLVPIGDELVELLIDPLNAGTRSPGDLYHIVIKPTGAYLAEQGVSVDPPCGPRRPWPADLEVATVEHDDRWTAELRIPLSAFGVEEASHAIWGFNITRFDASQWQYGTWSGAVGNAFDPLALGNLYLP